MSTKRQSNETIVFRFYCSVQKWHMQQSSDSHFWLTTQLMCHIHLIASYLYRLPLTTESVASFPCSQNSTSRPQNVADLSPNYIQHGPRNSRPKSNPNGTKNRTLSVFGATFSVREVCWNIWQYMYRNTHEKNCLFAVHLNRQELPDLGKLLRSPYLLATQQSPPIEMSHTTSNENTLLWKLS